MIETTMADREQELKGLLDQMAQHPERDWTEARARVTVLRTMLAGLPAGTGGQQAA